MSVPAFLARARRRFLLRDLLVAGLVSVAANLLAMLAVRVLNRLLGTEWPEVPIGLALFAVLGALTLRRNRAARVAERADRGLRTQDRLATFLDFRGRADVEPAFRSAQAAEAAAALAGVDVRRGIRIPRALWAAPLLFGWMLYADYFAWFAPFDLPLTLRTPRLVRTRRVPAPDAAAPGGGPQGDRTEDGAPAGKPPGEGSPPGERPPADPATPPEAATPPDAEKAPDAGDDAAAGGGSGSPAVFGEPARLFSETVGKRLTPVVDAGPPGAAGAPELELPLRGRISFNLVPADGGAGEGAGQGGAPGAGAAPGLGVTIDYDAVPPAYRPQVRRYFGALIRLFQGGTGGT